MQNVYTLILIYFLIFITERSLAKKERAKLFLFSTACSPAVAKHPVPYSKLHEFFFGVFL